MVPLRESNAVALLAHLVQWTDTSSEAQKSFLYCVIAEKERGDRWTSLAIPTSVAH